MTAYAARRLTAVATPPDPSVVEMLLPALAAALDGTGPAVLPLPGHDDLAAARLRRLLRPDDDAYPLEGDDVAVVAATSGSTGDPKGVLLTSHALQWAARAVEDRMGGPGRWLLALPAWHVGGLQVLVRSLVAGTTPVALDLSTSFTHAAFAEATAELRARNGPDQPAYTSIVPTQLARLLDGGREGIEALRAYDGVLVGAAATPPDLADRAREAGVATLLSYGMSETGGGCVYDGIPLGGLEIQLRESDGRVLVRGPSVFAGYRLRPDLTASTLDDGWLLTPDVGRWVDGRLEVVGRADDVVAVGGENVSPHAVADLLRGEPGVEDAYVVGVPDAQWGSALVAYVVAAGAVDQETLRARVRGALGRAAVPRRVDVLGALPLLSSGKVDRAALVERARAVPAPQRDRRSAPAER